MAAIYSPQFKNDFFTGQVHINTGHFINGKWVDGSSGTFIECATPLIDPHLIIKLTLLLFFHSVVNPTTGKLLTKVSEGTPKEVDLAVAAAQKAFDTVWGHKTSAAERGRLLNKLADIMESHFDELCAVEALDNGSVSLSNLT